MVLEAYSLCRPSVMTSGQIPLQTYYTGSDIRFHFPYEGFYWLPLLPPHWIYGLVGLLALAGVTMALGFLYRASAATVFLIWAYLFFVESTRTYWQSYYYLELLFVFLLLWMPAARRYSVDAWLARRRNPPRTVPYWTVLLLRAQLVIMYFYGGVAKLNADWLLDAAPLRWNLAEPHVAANFEPYLTSAQFEVVKGILHSAWFAYGLCYAGALFDLSIGFLLMIRRTRAFALVLMLIFHATNHFVIYDNIDWLPLVGATTALIFLNPDWPERFWSWLRRPRFARPDWRWFAAGAALFPVAGAALGWKSKAYVPPSAEGKGSHPIRRWAAPFVVGWLAWQALMPVRHYFIPGDGRFTYEGLSFSWRLKADDHRALGVQLVLKDHAIISRDEKGLITVNWNQWHGDRVIYRNVTPGSINWSELPEILIVLEPILGERVMFNPWAGTPAPRTEIESRERAKQEWNELYGREPEAIRATTPLSQVLDSLVGALHRAGRTDEATKLADLVPQARRLERNESNRLTTLTTLRDIREALGELRERDTSGEMMPLLRLTDPFALAGEGRRSVPFLVLEDSRLSDESRRVPSRVVSAAWKSGSSTRGGRRPPELYVGGEPLIVYTSNPGAEAGELLPQECIFDSQNSPELPPYIWWNCLRDLTLSKFNHISNQAFYLRRYARRVARLWEKEYNRRPVVQAATAVSLNRRPFQELVDPNADLASVPVSWFHHNAWIRDLQMPRIPRTAFASHGAD